MRFLIALFVGVSACGSPPASSSTSGDGESSSEGASTSGLGSTSEAETSASSTSTSGSTGEPSGSSSSGGSSGAAETGGSSSSGSGTTAAGPSCGDGVVDPENGETCDDGQETKLCDDDCTSAACGDAHVNAAAGEACDDGNVDDTDTCLGDCTAASCGDGNLWAGVEECDDGNTKPGDGCSETCSLERWSHVGVAHDVPVADLHLWEPEPCWSSTYEAGPLLAGVSESCQGDHLLVACRPAGADTLTLAAHAPRASVFAEVNYKLGERTQVNGVDFYWSPYAEGVVGFGPPGAALCYGQGTNPADNLCWKVDPMHFLDGRQCGKIGAGGMSVAQTKAWERVIFQAWD